MPQSMPMTKYHQIYLLLREQLHEGKFAQGLPGELALMKQFSVARVTVRRALEQLAAEGMISREPGRGTRALDVCPANAAPGAEKGQRARLTGLLENLVSMGLQTKVSVIEVETVTASASVAQALQLSPGDPVQKAIRVRSTREGPLSHITTYVPGDIGRRFGRRELARKPILLLLEESLSVIIKNPPVSTRTAHYTWHAGHECRNIVVVQLHQEISEDYVHHCHRRKNLR